MIGTAGEAIQRLAIPDAEKTALINNIPVAYAVTYLVGTATLVWFIPTIGPKLMGVDLRAGGRQAARRSRAASERPATAPCPRRRPSTSAPTACRTRNLIGRTIADIEALPKKTRAFIVRVRSYG